MDNKIAFGNLKDFCDVLTMFKVRWWLEAGTCLGMVRENDFIAHDMDIDIGILAEDFDWGIINVLVRDCGFKVKHIFGNRYCGFEIAFMRNTIKVDLFLFYKVGNKRWHAAWLNGGRRSETDLIKLVFDDRLVEVTTRDTFDKINENVSFFRPEFADEYLEARYGKDWRIPNYKWNWATDPKCINNDFKI